MQDEADLSAPDIVPGAAGSHADSQAAGKPSDVTSSLGNAWPRGTIFGPTAWLSRAAHCLYQLLTSRHRTARAAHASVQSMAKQARQNMTSLILAQGPARRQRPRRWKLPTMSGTSRLQTRPSPLLRSFAGQPPGPLPHDPLQARLLAELNTLNIEP